MNKNRNKNLSCALLINLLILCVYILLFETVLETNDEFAFSAFLSGAYGVRSSHLVFSNIFYGKILKLLYSLETGINWYSAFQFFFNFVSSCIISYIGLMRTERYGKRGVRCGICFSIVLVCAYEHYYLMQWTKSAYLIILAGVLLILYTLHEQKGKIFSLLCGGILVLEGSFIRFDAVLVVFAFAFVRCVYDLLIRQRFLLKKEYFQRNGKYILCFCLLIAVVFGFEIGDRLVYQYGPQKEAWKYYNEYNVFRSELLDYGIPEYEEHAEEYQEIGLSETDIRMLENWTFSDPEVFNVETFEKIVSMKEKKTLSFEIIPKMFGKMAEGARSNVGLLTIFVAFMYLINSQKKQKTLFPMYLVMMFALYGYLTYMDRVIFRSVYGIWISILAFCVYDYPKQRTGLKSELSHSAWVALIITILTLSAADYAREHENYNRKRETIYRTLFDYTNEHKENLYMRDVSTLCDWNQSFSVMETLPEGYLSNICLLGGWELENPITDTKSFYEIENPWRACVDSENIFIIDNVLIDLKVDYIRQRYCPTAKAELVDEVAGFEIYRIVSK